MQKIKLFLLFGLLVSCNLDKQPEAMNTQVVDCKFVNTEKVISIDSILPVTGGLPIYVNVVDSKNCFHCHPSFGMIASRFLEFQLPKENIVYVFPTMRKIEQELFLEENFGLTKDDITAIFNDKTFENFKKQFSLKAGSYLLTFDEEKTLKKTTEYQRNNYNVLVQNIQKQQLASI